MASRILVASAREWGIDTAICYDRLMRMVFGVVGADPLIVGSQEIPNLAGVRLYPLRLGRRRVERTLRAADPASDEFAGLREIEFDRDDFADEWKA